MRKPSSSRRTSIIDVNFNVEEETAEEEIRVELTERRVRRSRKKRRSKRGANVQDLKNTDTLSRSSDAATPETLTSGATTPDPNNDLTEPGTNHVNQELTLKLQELMGQANISDSSTNVQNSVLESNSGAYMDLDEAETDDKSEDVELDDDAKDRLLKLVAQSRLVYLSSTDDDLDKAGVSEEEDDAGPNEDLKFKLCRLEQQVRSTQFSSTEDELDRMGLDNDSRQKEDDDIADKVCKLVSQVGDAQFSSTEDELDLERVGSAAEREQVRNLAGLVSTCQFSSTEDELDRVGQVAEAESEVTCADFDRRESIGDLDVNMFELREDFNSINYLEMSKAGDFEKLEKDAKVMVYKATASVDSEIVGKVRSLESKTLKKSEVTDSEEDEAEFNRIINSMLMMTLEDMQVGGGLNVGETKEQIEHNEREMDNSHEDGQTSKELGELIEKMEREEVNKVTEDKQGDTQENTENKRYSAQSLRSITTEVLKVLNATEQLLQDTKDTTHLTPLCPISASAPKPPATGPTALPARRKRLHGGRFGVRFGGGAGGVEECARAVSSSTSQSELSFLEEQVATAAAQVQQSEMKISDISARIAALRNAGLNVDPQPQSFSKTRTSTAKAITLDTSRQQRRLLPWLHPLKMPSKPKVFAFDQLCLYCPHTGQKKIICSSTKTL
ncbi:hypothetical protein WMY93_000313 [Mugilogobius chulae]|uniref:Rab effector MyRIP/Melanophilin domain-containing protein n=1 Tax=Mugilogobius chulae TaxID=88201 RepID=A0AAW0Q927_9GOBI